MFVDVRRVCQIDFARTIGIHHEDIGIAIDISLPGNLQRFGFQSLAQRERLVGAADRSNENRHRCEHADSQANGPAPANSR
jgi:hypothetical protein